MIAYVLQKLYDDELELTPAHMVEFSTTDKRRVFTFDKKTFAVYIPTHIDSTAAMQKINSEMQWLAHMTGYYEERRRKR